MNKLKLIGATMSLAVLGSIVPAGAQITQFDADPQTLFGGKATGTYHVVLNHISGSLFGVSIFGNPDGNVTEPAGPPEQKHAARVITLGFKDFLFNQVNVTAGTGGTVGTTTETAPITLALRKSYVPATWSMDLSAGSYGATAPIGLKNRLSAYGPTYGGNVFNGFLNVSGAKYASIVIQDTDQQWFKSDVLLTPEASSLAMFLPGLVPIGLALRRRRRNRM
jgi:hypothetical protein